MMRFPSADRAASIAASMVLDGPGTIGVPAPGEDFFDFRDAKPALAGGGKKPQAACCRF